MGPRSRGQRSSNNNKKKKKKQRGGGGQSNKPNADIATTTTTPAATRVERWNFVPDAGPGCHIARPPELRGGVCVAAAASGGASAAAVDKHDENEEDWVLEWERVVPDEFDDDDDNDIPDLAVDPDERTLSVCNVRRHETVVAYITVYRHMLRGKRGRILQQGSTTSATGQVSPCTTLIVLCPPCTFAHLCVLDNADADNALSSSEDLDLQDLHIDSDVQVWNRHTQPNNEHPQALTCFPLRRQKGSNDDEDDDETQQGFLCTQGEQGHLTHFLSGNQHALDFRCPKGTPLVAVGDGVVIQASAEHQHVTGIAVSNLFLWNAILLQLDPPDVVAGEGRSSSSTQQQHEEKDVLYVEYVHIATASVQVGDRVTKGQVIGTSGGIGFSPEDHLHFAGYRSSEAHAPTVRLRFQNPMDQSIYYPRAGMYYNENGPVPASSS